MSFDSPRRASPAGHDQPVDRAASVTPFDGKSLEDLMELRSGIERRYDGPIPAWTLRAWDRAYRKALWDAIGE